MTAHMTMIMYNRENQFNGGLGHWTSNKTLLISLPIFPVNSKANAERIRRVEDCFGGAGQVIALTVVSWYSYFSLCRRSSYHGFY